MAVLSDGLSQVSWVSGYLGSLKQWDPWQISAGRSRCWDCCFLAVRSPKHEAEASQGSVFCRLSHHIAQSKANKRKTMWSRSFKLAFLISGIWLIQKTSPYNRSAIVEWNSGFLIHFIEILINRRVASFCHVVWSHLRHIDFPLHNPLDFSAQMLPDAIRAFWGSNI